MPWQLTTPYSGGDLDSGGVYDQVKVVQLQWRVSPENIVVVHLEYGTTVSEVWTPGLVPVGKNNAVIIQGTQYNALMTHVSNDGELTYDAVKRGIYAWLAANGYLDAGAVV